MKKRRAKVGIALSGGAARGVSHIGVLKALLEHDIHPEIVVGTSAGSVIGALYARGYTIDELENFVELGNSFFGSLRRVFSLGNPIRGLVTLEALRRELEEAFPVDDFSCLRYPLVVTAVNLQLGRLEAFREGPLIEAILASGSVPLLFPPTKINGYQYVDGGLFMNLPATFIRNECDVLIGSNVLPLIEPKQDELSNFLTIAQRLFTISVNATSAYALTKCDVVIEPHAIADYNIVNLTNARDLIEVGYQDTLSKIDDIKALMARHEEKTDDLV